MSIEVIIRSVKNAFVSGSFSVINVQKISNLSVRNESSYTMKDAASFVQTSDVWQHFGS